MSEYNVDAHLVGRRYACDECGLEMVRDSTQPALLLSDPPTYPSVCGAGHKANLARQYPGYDVVIASYDSANPMRRL